jgi:hypothetical protein
MEELVFLCVVGGRFVLPLLISLITTLHDRYQPVLAHRESEAAAVRTA